MKITLKAACILLLLLAPEISFSQKFYQGSEVNFIFSLGMVERNGSDLKTPVRFAPFFNSSYQLHLDFTKNIGIYSGLEIKNVGVILRDTVTSKHRAYSGGITLGAKIGRMDQEKYFFAGGSYEYFFAYKEKVFYNNEKIKRKNFYSHDVNQLIPALFAGVSLNGINFRLHYYLDDFFSDNYRFINKEGSLHPPFSSSKLFLFMVGFKRNIPDVYKKKKVLKTGTDV